MVKFATLVLCVFVCSQQALSQELLYPELTVSPKASERLKMEAEDESKSRWTTHIPMQVSALATLFAGIYAGSDKPTNATAKELDQADWASKVGIGVGVAWLGVTAYMATSYTPYADGLAKTTGLPTKTKYEQLVKERLSEEAIEAPAALAKRLTWLSVATNLGASAFIASSAGEKAKIVGGVAAVASLAPIIFRYHWTTVHRHHKNYKKRIYGPVASFTLLKGDDEALVPGFNWSMTF